MNLKRYYDKIYSQKIDLSSLRYIKKRTPTKAIKKQLIKNYVLKNSKKGQRILDIGCGIGEYLSLFEGYERYGIDISLNAIKIARKYCKEAKFIQANAEKLPFKKGFFDIVLMIDCLEHIPNDKKALNEALRVLKKRGLLILSTMFTTKKRTINFPINLSFKLNEFGEGGDLRAYGLDFIKDINKKGLEIEKEHFIDSFLSKKISLFKNKLLGFFFRSSSIIEKECKSVSSKNYFFILLTNLYYWAVLTILKIELLLSGEIKKNKKVFILCCRKL